MLKIIRFTLIWTKLLSAWKKVSVRTSSFEIMIFSITQFNPSTFNLPVLFTMSFFFTI